MLGLLKVAQAVSDWTAAVDTAGSTASTDLVELIGTYALPALVGILAGFFAIKWLIGKVFGRRK